MNDRERRTIIEKVRKLRALSEARWRVRQLERELQGHAPTRGGSPQLPEFLRKHRLLRFE